MFFRSDFVFPKLFVLLCHEGLIWFRVEVKNLLENSDEGKFSIISHGRGKYGRVLGEIFVKGHEKSVNELLKENGHAYEYHGEKKKVFGG